VPAKLAARVRLFDTGHNRKTDALDAHSIAVVAVRTKTLRVLTADGELEALRLLAELVPGQVKRDITALQGKAILATVRPRDIAGKTRRRIAAEELADLVTVEKKIKKATAELKTLVTARDSRLMDIPGAGPSSLPGSSPTSVTSHGSRIGTGSRPGPHRTPGRLLRSRTDTDSPAPGTVG
jgi:transposase